ncbi:MAG TPA: hypothetical protein VM716_05030 [Gemmatimonadales bacterium]|nr:hypothetical protein [Gemmatimonadales bacterium]
MREHPQSTHGYEPVREEHDGLRITRCRVCGLATEIDSDQFATGMPAALMAVVLAEMQKWELSNPT